MNEKRLDLLFALICSDPPEIELTPEQAEILDCLCDGDQKKYVLKAIELQRAFVPEPKAGPISSSTRDERKDTSDKCFALATRLESDWPHLSRGLKLLGQHYSLLAKDADPKGKRSGKLSPQGKLAGLLVELIDDGYLPHIRLSQNPTSDLADLFRLCCDISGLKSPRNVAHYLRPHIERRGNDHYGLRIMSSQEEREREICAMFNTEWPPYLDDWEGIQEGC